MIIILEGLDGCSKTTQAKNLSKNLNLTHFEESDDLKHIISFRRNPDDWKYFVTGINAQTLNVFLSFDNFVKDRFHLSEYAYSKLFNRESILSFQEIDNNLCNISGDSYCPTKNIPVLLFYLQINLETSKKRTQYKNDEGVYNDDEFTKLDSLFLECFHTSNLRNKFIIDANTSEEFITKDMLDVIYNLRASGEIQ